MEQRQLLAVNAIGAENALSGTPQEVSNVSVAGDPTVQGHAVGWEIR